MDRNRNSVNRNRPLRNRLAPRRNNLRALKDRRNRRQGFLRNRNRLFRAQNNININRRRFNNFRPQRNPNFRMIFVANLPFNINNRMLRNLFRKEGRITQSRIIYGNKGSKGYGFLEFYNPRDAWRSIQKWNNTFLGGRRIVVQYRKGRRFGNNNRRFNNNYKGFRYGSFRGGFRLRGNRY